MTETIIHLDILDRRLLRELSNNARASHFALGEAIGRSPSAIARRQKILEEAGVIAGYEARLDASRLGFATTIHIKVTLQSQRREIMEAFEAAIVASPSVIRCDLMSGADDYLLTVLARSLDHFAEIHREELSQLPGVVRMESGFVLREVICPRPAAALLE